MEVGSVLSLVQIILPFVSKHIGRHKIQRELVLKLEPRVKLLNHNGHTQQTSKLGEENHNGMCPKVALE